jgi:hypothetical protein
VYIGMEIEYIDRNEGFLWIKECNELLKMLNGLKKSYERKNYATK